MTAKEFWTAFEKYEKTLRFHMDTLNKEEIKEKYNYLKLLLQSYHPKLEAILSTNKTKDSNYKLTISSNENRDLFMYVNRLVEEAPSLPNWNIQAFKESEVEMNPAHLNKPFDFGEYSIKPMDIQFTVIAWDPEKNIFDLLLLLPLYLKPISQADLENAFEVIFQELWGERFVREKINCFIFTHHLSSEHEFFELELLETCLDSFEKI